MKPATQRRLRQLHLYLGVFFAPAILLFAVSGSLQTFRMHEVKGWGSRPPALLVWMASLHIDQRTPQAAPPKPAAAGVATAPKPVVTPKNFAIKTFSGLLGIGLALSTLLGIVIALNSRATRLGSLAMLAAGTLLPLAFVYL